MTFNIQTERNFCGAITPKEKDKIMKAILDMAAHERKTFCFTPNDVPNLRINGKQFEMVIMDFFEKGSLLLIGVISSCSNNEDNIPVDDYLTTNEWKLLAQDSTHIYYASINNESKKQAGKRKKK